jgi:hypothetical protein
MTPEDKRLIQDERLVDALEMLAAAVGSIARTMELTYYKTFPPRSPVRDIDLGHPETEDDKLRRAQGATGEATTKEWMTLHAEEEMGPREREFMERENRRAQGGADEDRVSGAGHLDRKA